MTNHTKRPAIPTLSGDEKEHRRRIAERANAALMGDGSDHGMSAPLVLKSYAVADLPDASFWTGGAVYVSDESGGAVLAYSDGVSWRRSTDRAVVS